MSEAYLKAGIVEAEALEVPKIHWQGEIPTLWNSCECCFIMQIPMYLVKRLVLVALNQARCAEDPTSITRGAAPQLDCA